MSKQKYADAVIATTVLVPGCWDRIKILCGWGIMVVSTIQTEHQVGATQVESTVVSDIPPRWLPRRRSPQGMEECGHSLTEKTDG